MHRSPVSSVPPGVVLAALLGFAAPAPAQPIVRDDVPPTLRPWIPWVLDEVRDFGCPLVQGRAVCVWPGRLRLDLGTGGGTFSLDVSADREAELRLPGSAEVWPQDVTLDSRAVAVYDRGTNPPSPRLRVPAGRHRVGGRFSWSRLPESLGLPPEIALLDLFLDGRRVPRPRREKGGLLWLRAREDEGAGEGESLRLQVFRRVDDGIPLFVDTRLQLEVSGRAREVTLDEALLPGTVPVAVSGDLAARVEEGTLRVQVRGGRYSVSVLARVEGRPETLERASAAAGPGNRPAGAGTAAAASLWPEREVWVFAAREDLRQVELSGPPAVDPSRTELPDDWRALPAFLVEPGGKLALRTVSRGQAEAAPDALLLAREMWLDPDGGAASVRDSFSGTLHESTRLDVQPPAALGRVAVDGQDQLITANPETGASGVELRRTSLQLAADSRVAMGGAVRAVGWTTGVEQLRASLHLPPGWSLLGASGVDEVPGSWTARWTLLGFFFVLLVAFAAHRLHGPRAAVLATVALVLTHGEPGAPLLVWLSLLAGSALHRVAPPGRLRRVGHAWFLLSAGVLVILLVPFARDQVKNALFPQVTGGEARVVGGLAGTLEDKVAGAKDAPAAAPVPMAAPPEVPSEESVAAQGEYEVDRAAREQVARKLGRASGLDVLSSSVRYATNVALEQDPKAVLQTGPGVPTWSWHRYSLGWTGPVGRDHEMRLFLASPGLNRFLMLVRLGLVALLAFVLFTGRWPRLPRPRGPETIPAIVGASLLLLLVALPAGAADESGAPDAKVLEDLKKRLTRGPACAPGCVTTPSLRLRLGSDRLELGAEVHADDDGTWAIPGPLASWAPTEVRVDGTSWVGLAQLPDGFLHVRLRPGVHRLEASGPLPPGDSFTLQFASVPRRARADAAGWDVSGLRADGPPDASILLSRRLPSGPGGRGVSEGGRYAPWLEITRTLGFGVSWTVQTTIRRLTPLGAPVAVRVPLLPGEAPTRAQLVVEKGEVAVSLGADEVETSWQSTLEQTEEITLHAPEGRPWSEVWRLQCSSIWSCAALGLPPVQRAAGDVFEPAYRPWPGESLQVRLAHPAGAPGQTLTLDSVGLEATPGTRLERALLHVQARSSREQPLVLRLPEQAEVQQVLVDGSERPLRPEKGELRVTVPAGRHAIAVRWQQERGIGTVYSTPRVGVSGPAVNVTQTLRLPPSRWILFTWGPAWGPAVLFWPYLVFLLALATGLGRMPGSPLTSAQWVLLGLGLSQISALGALVVAGFVFALAARGRKQPESDGAFNLSQLGLALWALVSLVLLYTAIQRGLLFTPDMQVAGNGSTDDTLVWYADRVAEEMPSAGVASLPLWVYRVGMLAWALWLAASLVRAFGWGWRAFAEGGLWRKIVLRRPSPPPGREPKGDPSAAPPDAKGGASDTSAPFR